MKSYTLISKNGNQSTFTFNDAELLIEFKADAAMSTEALTWLLERIPVKHAELQKMATGIGAKLVEVQLDLSFEKFWQEYDYKVGNKTKCKKLWEALTDADKSVALSAIGRYKRYLQVKTTIEQVYPERFISHRRFENDFRS